MARSSPGVRRVAAILNFMADHPGQAFALTDLVRALKLSRATCHALLTGLVEVGYLYRASDKTYVLGPALAAIGRTAAANFSPLQVAQPEMRQLADRFDVVCSAVFLEGDSIVIRERAASVSHVGYSAPLGTRAKLRSPFAAAFFAWSPEDAEEWLDRENPPPNAEQREALMESMEFGREHGFLAFLRNPAVANAERAAEQVFGAETAEFPVLLAKRLAPDEQYPLISITAPVFERPGKVAFVIGLMGVNRRIRGQDVLQIADELRGACGRITDFIAGTGERRAAA
ncbi:MAG: helix-turn-helix domain-containing protein [Novosphingobium sp.]